MKKHKMKEVSNFVKKLKTAREFNGLKPHHNIQHLQKAELYFSGYNDLILTIMDIIKVCASALDGAEDFGNSPNSASALNISEVLGIALKLMPIEETQILDECYKLHLKLKAKN